MNVKMSTPERVLVMGIGNSLLTDDGVGVHVSNALAALAREGAIDQPVHIIDGGTIGLSLLSEINPESPLIAIDAMQLHAAPGTVRVFVGEDMDSQLRGTKRTAHEVALADLMQAAQLSGFGPERRALVAIQPDNTTWGLSPTPAVQAAIPIAVQSVLTLMEGWRDAS